MSGAASAPASSGNLGPGFDCLALALELRCRAEVEPAPEWTLQELGTEVPLRPDDRIRRAVAGVAEGSFRVRIENDIPRSRGLGSSSAVSAAAAAAAQRACGLEVDPRRVFQVVAELEGHEDNAAAAVYGGLVLAGGGRIRHLPLAGELRIIVGIPDYELKTSLARAALPPEIDRPTVARSLARLGFLIEGLRSGAPDLLAGAAGDEIHEAPRAHLSPTTGDLIAAAVDAGALHACWSGAGPTAMALVTDGHAGAVTAAMSTVLDGAGSVRTLEVATEGVL